MVLFNLGLLSLVPLVAAAGLHRSHCGTPSPGAEFMKLASSFSVAEAKESHRITARDAAITITTYMHIIAEDRSYNGGYVSQKTIDEQMSMLNANFGSTGYQFALRNVSYTIDPYYARLKNQNDEYALKKSLRQGSYRDLNLYYHVNLWTNNTGWCTYPAGVTQGSTAFDMDGCTMDVGTMPGGAYSPWNRGKLTSHEVGHWMGLMHTFENGCNGDGDAVDDTPASASPTYGCPEGRNSCIRPGLDPIHNFMDYSDNDCQYEFTPGQAQRMRSWFDYYRGYATAS